MIQTKPSMRCGWRNASAGATTTAFAAAIAIAIPFAAAVAIAAIAFAPTVALAQYDPAQVYIESAAVAARFPDPDVRYTTPSLATERNDFATHQEVFRFSELLATRSRHARTIIIGRSQQGRSIPSIVLTHDGIVDVSLPMVMIIGGQHGNEPAGSEAALAIAERLATVDSAMLERVNVIIVPRANPDASELFRRASANGIDINRDHLLLQTPEGRALADTIVRYRPHVVLDLHEFTVGGRWVEKLGAVERYDALLQAATVANVDSRIAGIAERDYVDAVRRALGDKGFSTFAYHTTSSDAADPVVSMGGVRPDTGRNVNALRPAISLLIEVRGVGIGRAHLQRRVHVHTTAALAVVSIAATQGSKLVAAIDSAAKRIASTACTGTIGIEARHTASRQRMTFLDAKSGDEREVDVDWRSASPLDVVRSRPRPCGYLVGEDQAETLDRLRRHGVRIDRVRAATRPARGATGWHVESYTVLAEHDRQRQDARGAIDDAQPIRALRVEAKATPKAAIDRMVYVSMEQPMAALIAAALEPDTQNSYAANRLVDTQRVLRVMKKPSATMLDAQDVTAKKKPAKR